MFLTLAQFLLKKQLTLLNIKYIIKKPIWKDSEEAKRGGL